MLRRLYVDEQDHKISQTVRAEPTVTDAKPPAQTKNQIVPRQVSNTLGRYCPKVVLLVRDSVRQPRSGCELQPKVAVLGYLGRRVRRPEP
jgi:hypothetical protein